MKTEDKIENSAFDSDDLFNRISETKPGEKTVEDTLSTDERVFARITDGIYREPASALRELISNAYDADATEVVITTDFPRFSRITIKDNGNGLSQKSVARLVKHIGGSSKRTFAGKEVGTVNKNDSSLSPGGRKLIGKIGIGLFAVSQLTPKFRLITKQENDDFYIILDVMLTQYRESDLVSKPGEKYKSGSVRIFKEKASDPSKHGTEIILKDLKPASKRELSSFNLWERIESDSSAKNKENDDETFNNIDDFKEEITQPPKYHIGRIDPKNNEYIAHSACLPWISSDTPEEKFRNLVERVIDEQANSTLNPSLSTLLDNYLQTIWNLSISAPLEYLDFNPWQQPRADGFRYFKLSNSTRGQAEEIASEFNSIKDEIDNNSIPPESTSPFNLYFDGVKLFRPLKFNGLPKNRSNNINDSLFFFGQFEKDLSTFGDDYSGGNRLAFDAFAFWNSSINPKEHRGVIIRVNDASGNTFDSTFLGYQVSEQTRLRQITFEINVREGLDAAINIDRESFNYAHPHYQIIKRWVHSAIRQIVNKLKRIAKEIREEKKSIQIQSQLGSIEKAGLEEWRKFSKDTEFSEPPEVQVFDLPERPDLFEQQKIKDSRMSGSLVFDKTVVVPKTTKDETQVLAKIKAVTKILHAFNVLDDMDYDRQQELIRAITRIFTLDE